MRCSWRHVELRRQDPGVQVCHKNMEEKQQEQCEMMSMSSLSWSCSLTEGPSEEQEADLHQGVM